MYLKKITRKMYVTATHFSIQNKITEGKLTFFLLLQDFHLHHVLLPHTHSSHLGGVC